MPTEREQNRGAVTPCTAGAFISILDAANMRARGEAPIEAAFALSAPAYTSVDDVVAAVYEAIGEKVPEVDVARLKGTWGNAFQNVAEEICKPSIPENAVDRVISTVLDKWKANLPEYIRKSVSDVTAEVGDAIRICVALNPEGTQDLAAIGAALRGEAVAAPVTTDENLRKTDEEPDLEELFGVPQDSGHVADDGDEELKAAMTEWRSLSIDPNRILPATMWHLADHYANNGRKEDEMYLRLLMADLPPRSGKEGLYEDKAALNLYHLARYHAEHQMPVRAREFARRALNALESLSNRHQNDLRQFPDKIHTCKDIIIFAGIQLGEEILDRDASVSLYESALKDRIFPNQIKTAVAIVHLAKIYEMVGEPINAISTLAITIPPTHSRHVVAIRSGIRSNFVPSIRSAGEKVPREPCMDALTTLLNHLPFVSTARLITWRIFLVQAGSVPEDDLIRIEDEISRRRDVRKDKLRRKICYSLANRYTNRGRYSETITTLKRLQFYLKLRKQNTETVDQKIHDLETQ